MRKKIISFRTSLGLILDKTICSLLRITKETKVDLWIQDGALLVRPVLPEPGSGRQDVLWLLRELDVHGLTRDHFQILSHDGQSHGVVCGAATLGDPVDPVTVERLKECLERRQNCAETWDATIQAVMARKRSATSTPHPTCSSVDGTRS